MENYRLFSIEPAADREQLAKEILLVEEELGEVVQLMGDLNQRKGDLLQKLDYLQSQIYDLPASE